MGGAKTGGMNVYIGELARELGRLGIQVDVFTRRSLAS
ncbi:MAG: glycosyltransferase, partial [Chloroflexi bacterium]|nr:glycosyltransferase [Chloroflexota bacterium]